MVAPSATRAPASWSCAVLMSDLLLSGSGAAHSMICSWGRNFPKITGYTLLV
jgi:hypothetical protein